MAPPPVVKGEEEPGGGGGAGSGCSHTQCAGLAWINTWMVWNVDVYVQYERDIEKLLFKRKKGNQNYNGEKPPG